MAAIAAFMNLDARDVDPLSGEHEGVSGGPALEGAPATVLAGTGCWHGESIARSGDAWAAVLTARGGAGELVQFKRLF